MRLALVLACAVAAGCAALEPPHRVTGMVDQAVSVSRAAPSEQQAALAKAEKASASGAPADRLRLALLLATLPEPLRDDARALDLLQSIDSGTPEVGRFAALLGMQIAERQRLARELERTAREHERSQKEHEKREEALKQQIEALRAIERGILEREEKLRRGPK